jgi:hypothetical protein
LDAFSGLHKFERENTIGIERRERFELPGLLLKLLDQLTALGQTAAQIKEVMRLKDTGDL